MGRQKKYRNASEKQRAYRQRKKEGNWSDILREKVSALRKTMEMLDNTKFKGRIEVYKRFDGIVTYKILRFVYEYQVIDQETFEAIEPELQLVSQTWDTRLYRLGK